MRYTYKDGVKKQKSRKWLLVPVTGLIVGFYVLITFFSPAILYVMQPTDTAAVQLKTQQPDASEGKLFIPKINLIAPIAPADTDEVTALEDGLIQRNPSGGDPVAGGNYVIAGHDFDLGMTPSETKKQSPFYYIDRLQQDDDVYIDFKGVRYVYRITEVKTATFSPTELEEKTDTARLTLYSWGSSDDTSRDVVIAKPIGKIVWTSGEPRLQTF